MRRQTIGFIFGVGADLFTQGLTQDVQGGPRGVILPVKPDISERAMFLAGSGP